MNVEPLITKFRPITFDEVLGNQGPIKALREAVGREGRPHCYLFTGPPGIGKTTLARIVAKELDSSVTELDGGTSGGVADTRLICETAIYKPITGKARHMIIIDECQGLSKDAWKPLLKLLEDPPSYLYFALCTTEPEKVNAAIVTRCHPVRLKPLKRGEIEELLELVISIEKWEVDNDVFNAIVVASQGSARMSLSILEAGHSCVSREELSTIVSKVESENSPIIQLCQLLIKGNKEWKTISQLLEAVEEPEEAIAHACSYLARAMTRSEERQADNIWRIIQCLSENRAIWDKRIQLYAGIGKHLFGSEPF